MISSLLTKAIEKKLSEKFNISYSIIGIHSIGGGCINDAQGVETNHGTFFLKWNDAERYPGMFEAEAKGLELLRSANVIYIPEVIATGTAGSNSFIMLEFVEAGKRSHDFWKDFGKNLARLHQHTSGSFGLDHDNYIGSLPQSNSEHSSWIEFFISERLEMQIAIARDSGALGSSTVQQFNRLYKKLPEIIPQEPSALLHGDLWNGNYMTAPDGTACLIDPAVYYGHREMDLAMTRLFGGFDSEFYESYDETFPLQKGFESRVDLHNLYPLLVHVNLFGGGYVQQVKSIVSGF